MTEIITRIPPAYFIPIEGTDTEPFNWLNAAKIERVELQGDKVFIYLESKDKMILTRMRGERFLAELRAMVARYQLTDKEKKS